MLSCSPGSRVDESDDGRVTLVLELFAGLGQTRAIMGVLLTVHLTCVIVRIGRTWASAPIGCYYEPRQGYGWETGVVSMASESWLT